MSFAQALICGLLYFWSKSFVPNQTAGCLMQPLPAGFIVGLLFGDVQTGALVGAAIQPMYLANFSVGGTVVADIGMAGIIPTAMVLAFDMPIEAAIAISVPFGLLGSQISTLQQIIIAYLIPSVDKAAEKLDRRGIVFHGMWVPLFVKFITTCPVVFALLYFGGAGVVDVIRSLPDWAMAGLRVISGVLPALGYAMIMTIIGRKELLPYFAAGFLFAAYTGLDAIAIVCAGMFVAYIHIRTFAAGEEIEMEDEEEAPALPAKNVVTKKDFRRYALGCWALASMSHNPYKLHAMGLGVPMSRLTQKLYADDPQELKAAYLRHNMPYITNFDVGSLIHGAIVSMEEQRAADRESMPAEAIISLKNALAGPLAAIGDTIDGGTVRPIMLSIGTMMVAEGGFIPAAIIFPLLYSIFAFTELMLSMHYGYKLGQKAALLFLGSRKMKIALEFLSVMGMFTLAGIASSMMSIKLGIVINAGGESAFAIQSIFDKIMPKLLSFAALFGIYTYLNKGGKMMRVLYVILLAGFVLGAVGILV